MKYDWAKVAEAECAMLRDEVKRLQARLATERSAWEQERALRGKAESEVDRLTAELDRERQARMKAEARAGLIARSHSESQDADLTEGLSDAASHWKARALAGECRVHELHASVVELRASLDELVAANRRFLDACNEVAVEEGLADIVARTTAPTEQPKADRYPLWCVDQGPDRDESRFYGPYETEAEVTEAADECDVVRRCRRVQASEHSGLRYAFAHLVEHLDEGVQGGDLADALPGHWADYNGKIVRARDGAAEAFREFVDRWLIVDAYVCEGDER